jgi:hypothetical protein
MVCRTTSEMKEFHITAVQNYKQTLNWSRRGIWATPIIGVTIPSKRCDQILSLYSWGQGKKKKQVMYVDFAK